MHDIKPFIHKFTSNGNELKIEISRINGLWKAKVISGKTSIGCMSGGRYETIQEYIKDIEIHHNYSNAFFSRGYSYAKSKFSNQ